MAEGLARAPIFDRLSALGDTTRSRILLLLEGNELTVTELAHALQLPQPTVSRHLKVLADDGWVGYRAEGTSRHYRIRTPLEEPSRELWRIVREQVGGSDVAREDAERVRAILVDRVERSRAFFASSAGRWDGLRDELFGTGSHVLPFFGLLEPDWIVGDLGCGTGQLTARLAPFVSRVVGVDRSEAMLEAARTRIGSLEAGNVELRAGELEALPLDDGELDLAVALLVLHYVPDPRAALTEAARVLVEGGRLVVVDMRSHDRSEYREEMGHLWQGFGAEQMEDWMETAGLCGFRYAPVPPDPEAKGPPLFVAAGVKGG